MLCNTITYDRIVLTKLVRDLRMHDMGWQQCIACIKRCSQFVLDRHKLSSCNCMRVMHMCMANCLYTRLKLKCVIAVSLLIKLNRVHFRASATCKFCYKPLLYSTMVRLTAKDSNSKTWAALFLFVTRGNGFRKAAHVCGVCTAAAQVTVVTCYQICNCFKP